MNKKQKWTDEKIQKLFNKDVLSKIHSTEFNFGCVFLYADIEAKNPDTKILTNQLNPNDMIMLSNALYSLVHKRTSSITAYHFKEDLKALLAEVTTNDKGGEA